jgi:hypothetical protein
VWTAPDLAPPGRARMSEFRPGAECPKPQLRRGSGKKLGAKGANRSQNDPVRPVGRRIHRPSTRPVASSTHLCLASRSGGQAPPKRRLGGRRREVHEVHHRQLVGAGGEDHVSDAGDEPVPRLTVGLEESAVAPRCAATCSRRRREGSCCVGTRGAYSDFANVTTIVTVAAVPFGTS